MSSHFHQEFPSLQAAGEVKDGQEEEPYGPGPSLRPQSMDTATTGERGGLHSRLQFSLVIQYLKFKKTNHCIFRHICGCILGGFFLLFEHVSSPPIRRLRKQWPTAH